MFPLAVASLMVAMVTAWLATPVAIRLANAIGAVDRPGARKVHREPTPRIGGLAVFAGFVAGLAFAAEMSGLLFQKHQVSVYWSGLAIAASGMLVVGLVDDVRGLSFQSKFAAQIVAAASAWYCGFQVEILSLPIVGPVELGMASLPLTVLWVVGATNAVNLIDGLDGLATGIALITTTTVAVISYLTGELGVTAASVVLSGSLMGFLFFNFNPARIFLGDSGSMFLGFVLAVISVRGSQKTPTAVAILVPLLVLGVPLLDTGFAVVRRAYRLAHQGLRSDSFPRHLRYNYRQIFLPDRDHIHHRLLDLGLSPRRAVSVLYGLGLIFAASAFAMYFSRTPLAGLILVLVLSSMMAGFLLVLYVRSGRRRAASKPSESPSTGQPIPADVKRV